MRTHYKGTRGHRRKAGARWIGVGTGHPTGLGRSRPALLESLEGRTLLSTVIAEDFSAGASGFAAAGGTWSASAGAYGVTTPDVSATTHLNTRSIHPTAVDGDGLFHLRRKAIEAPDAHDPRSGSHRKEHFRCGGND